MSSQDYIPYKPHDSFYGLSTGSIHDFDFLNLYATQRQQELENIKPPRKRRDDTNVTINQLYQATFVGRPGECDVVRTGGRKNKNEILGLTNARLIKEKYLNGSKYLRDVELTRGLQGNVSSGEFVLVLRPDGRIVAMSDEVVHHLGKTMRSLYTQCMNIFRCLDKNDGERLRQVLNTSDVLGAHEEHRLVCTFRLPKGKRPSRVREDIKAISMVGHFYSCPNLCSDRLFIARCETLLSHTSNGTSSSQTTITSNTTIRLTLNEDMTVSMMSSNVRDILGYSRNEIIGNWFGRLLATDDLNKFEAIRQTHLQNDLDIKPTSIYDVFDVYKNRGEDRLTFLCQLRPMRERRSRTIKYSIIGQLIDPSMRGEYIKHIPMENEATATPIKVEQVNLVSPAVSKTSEENIMANSPSLANGLLVFESNDYAHPEQSSPIARTLSNVVAPFIFDDASLQVFQYDQCWPLASIDDTFIKHQLEQELASIDAIINDF